MPKSENTSERNARIVADRSAGMSYVDISKKYGISITRGQQIVKHAAWQDRDNEWLRGNPVIASLAPRTRRFLMNGGIMSDAALIRASDGDLLDILYIGPMSLDEINKARGR